MAILKLSNVPSFCASQVRSCVLRPLVLTIRPLVVAIEQAITKRVLTAGQRATLTVEFSLEGLLRSNLKDRAEIYSTMVQNGLMTRREARQLENLPPMPGDNELTAQTNLAPVAMLGVAQRKGADNAVA